MRSERAFKVRRTLAALIALLMVLSGCAAKDTPKEITVNVPAITAEASPVPNAPAEPMVSAATEEAPASAVEEEAASTEEAPAPVTTEPIDGPVKPEEPAIVTAEELPVVEETPQELPMIEEETELQDISLTVAEQALTVEWTENASVDALRELLEKGPLTVELSQYGGFEQVGALGTSLPRSDAQTTTEPGDIVLYAGNQIVMFYGSNTWAYTRLGRITGMNREELAALLGVGGVTVTLSLTEDNG